MTDWLLTAEQRAGLKIAVISGGRPLLSQRPVHKLLPAFAGTGFPPPVWVVDSRDSPGYERDGHEHVVYPHDWAYEYACGHWMSPERPPTLEGFLGGFPARQWICDRAETEGAWGCLHLDDNVLNLAVLRGTATSSALARDSGGLAFYADLLGALSLSTNGAMTGAALEAVIPSVKDTGVLIRPGFTYSLFIEKAHDREAWLGPFEEDITQAFQYDQRPGPATSLVVPLLRYSKEHQSHTGMRAAYDQTRSVQLQRLIPQGANIGIRKTRSNGKGTPRVFHGMTRGALRTPLRVTDPLLFRAAKDRLTTLIHDWYQLDLAANREKVRNRTRRHEERTRT